MPTVLMNPVMMFLALFSLYSPIAAVSSYFPIVSKMTSREQAKLALGLFTYVVIFAMVAIWIGEPLLELLGLTTAALTVTGGIALIYVGVPLMRGTVDEPAEEPHKEEMTEEALATKKTEQSSWKSVLFMPVTFPLTVGGTTFAILVSFRAQAENLWQILALSIAGVAYAAITGLTVYASGHLERRVKPQTRILLERIAGILLTAIAVSLFASGVPRMVHETMVAIQEG